MVVLNVMLSLAWNLGEKFELINLETSNPNIIVHPAE